MQEILREGGFIMKIIDLTHTISEDMPVYTAGTEPRCDGAVAAW